MSSLFLTCNDCWQRSGLPRQYQNLAVHSRTKTFCQNCNKVSTHTITSISPASAEQQPQFLFKPGAKNFDGEFGANNVDNFDNSNNINQTGEEGNNFGDTGCILMNPQHQQQQQQITDAELWTRLLDLLARHNIPLEDLYKSPPEARMELFNRFGFEVRDQQRLFELANMNQQQFQSQISIPSQASTAIMMPIYGAEGQIIPGSFDNTGMPQNTPTSSMISGAQQQPQPILSDVGYPSASSTTVTNSQYGLNSFSEGIVTANNDNLFFGEAAIPGLSQLGGNIIARCTVHPELPAEFWCAACGCLVSSRCHVTGIHKDHPFITLRSAAEAHVRDVAAWVERCRSQLEVVNTTKGNLSHSQVILTQNGHEEFANIDKYIKEITNELVQWGEHLKKDIAVQIEAQTRSIEQAISQVNQMYSLYSKQLQYADPLLQNMPAIEQKDRTSENWSLRLLDFVTKLKNVSSDPVLIPKLLIPEVRCEISPSFMSNLISLTNAPISVRLPDVIDPGYFNFPQPTVTARQGFELTMPPDGRQKGVVVESGGRTLSRLPDTAPSHTLVTGSQIFYSGTVSWDVYVDRVGYGVGRVLAGVIIQGTDGEGVVWDGYRIVGPNEGESRTISEKYRIVPGTVLSFVLELDTPHSFLNCYFDREGVARIPLPAASTGWVPAFSVFGPEDQITVIPLGASAGASGALPGQPQQSQQQQLVSSAMVPPNVNAHLALTAGALNESAVKSKLEQQELMLSALQYDVKNLNEKLTSAASQLVQQQRQSESKVSTPTEAEGGRNAKGSPHLISPRSDQIRNFDEILSGSRRQSNLKDAIRGSFSASANEQSRPGSLFVGSGSLSASNNSVTFAADGKRKSSTKSENGLIPTASVNGGASAALSTASASKLTTSATDAASAVVEGEVAAAAGAGGEEVKSEAEPNFEELDDLLNFINSQA